MQKQTNSGTYSYDRRAQYMPRLGETVSLPEGAFVCERSAGEDRVAVLYNHGDTPPEITITKTSEQIQTIHADGVAVAIVADAQGAQLTENDVLLVERYVRKQN